MAIEARQRIHAIALTKIHAAVRFVTVSIIIETALIAWLIGGN
jgi:hypothetical protein